VKLTFYLDRFAVKELKISDFENGNSSHRGNFSSQAENISKEVRIYKEVNFFFNSEHAKLS